MENKCRMTYIFHRKFSLQTLSFYLREQEANEFCFLQQFLIWLYISHRGKNIFPLLHASFLYARQCKWMFIPSVRIKRVVARLFCTVTVVLMRTVLLVVLHYDVDEEKCRLFRAWNEILVKNISDVRLVVWNKGYL